jgi:serine/threonine protein kinase
MHDSMENRQIGQYTVQQRLASGGMAVVYKAYDQQRKQVVAFKVLRGDFLDQPQVVLRFRREAEIAQELAHPQIVPFYDFGEQDGMLYMVMKFMEAGSLSDRLDRMANVTLGKTARWLRQVSGALEFAHSKGIVHRDLKPGNILMANDDDAYLSDFGIARISEATQLTLTDQGMPGTMRYLSPEQAQSDPRLDYRSDIYTFGVIAYLLATGYHPFTAENDAVIVFKHLNETPPLPSAVNKSLPLAVDEVLMACLAKDPTQRPQSATGFVTAFENAIARYHELMVIVNPNAANPGPSTSSPLTSAPTTPVEGLPEDIHATISDFYRASESGDLERARTLLTQIRRSGQAPKMFDIEAAERSLQSGPHRTTREEAYAQLRDMVWHAPPDHLQAAIQTFCAQYPGYDPDKVIARFGPARNYAYRAAIVLPLYLLGPLGLIANLVFLWRARGFRKAGGRPRNVGCLWALLALAILAGILSIGAGSEIIRNLQATATAAR